MAVEKPVLWLHGEIKSPPFTDAGRLDAGGLLGLLQAGACLSMPFSRPLPVVGPRCHELRVRDARHNWRIVYRTDSHAILVAAVFAKTTKAAQQREFAAAVGRLTRYDAARNG